MPTTLPAGDPLTQLRDIHLPDPVSWWPLAPGWWLVFVFLSSVLIIAGLKGWRCYLQHRPKREALQRLRQCMKQYQHDGNRVACSARVSELLRQVALSYFPRVNVAGLQGDAWIEFLQQSSYKKNLNFDVIRYELLDLPYQSSDTLEHAESSDTQRYWTLFLTTVHAWIKARRRPCLN